jgi:competence protein ComEA
MKQLLVAWLSWFTLVGASSAAVDANTASKDALQSVSGIGPSIAQRIVDERRKGPYKDLADLQARVKGIGESKARRMIASGLRVSGPVARKSETGARDPESGARKPETIVQTFVGGRAASLQPARR